MIERIFAAIVLLWIVACWVGVFWMMIVGQFGLAFGLAFASLSLPLIFEAFEDRP